MPRAASCRLHRGSLSAFLPLLVTCAALLLHDTDAESPTQSFPGMPRSRWSVTLPVATMLAIFVGANLVFALFVISRSVNAAIGRSQRLPPQSAIGPFAIVPGVPGDLCDGRIQRRGAESARRDVSPLRQFRHGEPVAVVASEEGVGFGVANEALRVGIELEGTP